MSNTTNETDEIICFRFPEKTRQELSGIGVSHDYIEKIEAVIMLQGEVFSKSPQPTVADSVDDLLYFSELLLEALGVFKSLDGRALAAFLEMSPMPFDERHRAFEIIHIEASAAHHAADKLKPSIKKGRPSGQPYDYLLYKLAQFSDACGFADNLTSLGRLIEVVFHALDIPVSNSFVFAKRAIREWEKFEYRQDTDYLLKKFP